MQAGFKALAERYGIELAQPLRVESVIGTKIIKNGHMCISVDYALVARDEVEEFVSEARSFEHFQPVHVHLGTQDVTGRAALLEGASLAHAQISGAYFPVELTADEILMSVNFGTRLRYRTK